MSSNSQATRPTLKSLPPTSQMRPQRRGLNATEPRSFTTEGNAAAAAAAQDFAMQVLDAAVSRYLDAVAAEKAWKAEYEGSDGPFKDCSYDVVIVYERWGDLRRESWIAAEEHLIRVVQCLRGGFGPNELEMVGLIPCGMKYGDHYFLCIPRDEDSSGDLDPARLICIAVDQMFDPATEGVRL